LTYKRLGYAEALAELESRGRFGIRLGLGRTRALLSRLDHPERTFRGALIAGTNGKGSVLALMGSVLTTAGLTVGETPKPHLVTYRERLQIGGRPVDRETFAALASRVLAEAETVARRHGDPTEFELLTAITFLWFAEAGLDVALVEVGLGGRLDATHAWDGGVAVVTNISLDHTDRLGTTVEVIAHEKAAIIMRGDLAVTGAWGSALDVIERRSRRVAAPLIVTRPAPLLATDRDGIEVELGPLGRVRIGLRGRHQAANVAVADAALDALEAAGIARVSAEQRRAGYAAVRWPGRLELIESGGREIVLDGAHNPAGAATLAEALDDLAPFLRPGPPTLVLAIMADKDVDGVIRAIAASTFLRGARVICTAPAGGRALPADRLAARWEALAGWPAESIAEPAAALDAAISPGSGATSGSGGGSGAPSGSGAATGPIVVAGSLYLVGAARGMLVADPDLVPDPPIPHSEGGASAV
jgi:dihydrofolate synthase / folylpolyglutamate synthase